MKRHGCHQQLETHWQYPHVLCNQSSGWTSAILKDNRSYYGDWNLPFYLPHNNSSAIDLSPGAQEKVAEPNSPGLLYPIQSWLRVHCGLELATCENMRSNPIHQCNHKVLDLTNHWHNSPAKTVQKQLQHVFLPAQYTCTIIQRVLHSILSHAVHILSSTSSRKLYCPETNFQAC